MSDDDKDVLKIFNRSIRNFIEKSVSVETFSDEYGKLWRQWRDSTELYRLNKKYMNVFDRIFTALDCFSPDGEHKTDWSIDENRLRNEISDFLELIEGSSDSGNVGAS